MRILIAFIFLFTQTTWGQTTGKNIEFNSVTGADYFTNYVIQPSAKKNAASTTTSNASVSKGTTNKIDNVASYSVDASAQNGYVEFTLGTVYDPATSGNCEFKGVFKGDGTLYKAQIVDGSGNLLNQTSVLANETNWRPFSVTYPCAASGSRKVRITQTESGTAPAFSVGKLYYGQITGLVAGVPNNVFSAKIGIAGAVTDENEDFINGSCTVSDSSLFTCPLVTGKFSVAPNWTIAVRNGADPGTSNTSVTLVNSQTNTSQVQFRTVVDASKAVLFIDIKAERAGTDFIQPAITPAIPSSPTVQRFTSGSGTYTTPAGIKYLRIRAIGGGGGGSGSGSASGGNGGTGGTTTFGSVISCTGGTGGLWASATSSSGGTCTITAVTIVANILGSSGQGGSNTGIGQFVSGGIGASSPLGGAGVANFNFSGGPAAVNSGSGGGAASLNAAVQGYSGNGGASGGYAEAIISAPSATYSYQIGVSGTAGTAGTSGNAGGAGGSGYIEVTEYYGSQNAPMLVGSVTSNSSGALRIESAIVAPTSGVSCTVSAPSSSWISTTTPNAAGDCTLTLSGFSATPICQITSGMVSGGLTTIMSSVRITSLTSTSLRFLHSYADDSAGTISGIVNASSESVYITCMGVR